MKILRLTSAITLLAVVLSITTSAKPSDERDLATKIVGIWMPHPNEYGLFFKGGIQTFRADKTLTGAGAVRAGSRNREVQIEGKWWLERDVLCEEVTKSSLPEVVPIGHRYRETILGISQEEMLARGEDGKEHLLTRFKK